MSIPQSKNPLPVKPGRQKKFDLFLPLNPLPDWNPGTKPVGFNPGFARSRS
ncbi:MAG: hypothetical protein JSV88_20740 [Candidatus Aminicenantes bacterium]|nr:MAG: hypothetical protein JSV88_20740 [Candidatus Aminicenantes bacterium]